MQASRYTKIAKQRVANAVTTPPIDEYTDHMIEHQKTFQQGDPNWEPKMDKTQVALYSPLSLSALGHGG